LTTTTFGAPTILPREIAPADQRNAHRIEEAVAGEHQHGGRRVAIGAGHRARRQESHPLAVAAKWQVANSACRYHAWHHPHTVEYCAIHQRQLARCGMSRARDGVVDGKPAFRRESEVDVCELDEASRHQPGAYHQHHGQRHLGDYECVAQAAAATSAAASAFAQRLLQLRTRRTECRHESERDAGEDGQCRGEQHHASVERDVFGARQLTGAQPNEELRADPGDEHTQRAADAGKYQALREQLPNDPSLSGAERRADGQLAFARRCAGEQQTRQVHRRHQQHETHGAQQHEQTRANLSNDRLLQRHRQRSRSAGVGVGILLG
jgi:hypothetical protein